MLQLKEGSQAPQAKTNVPGAEDTVGLQLCFESLAVTFSNIHGAHLQFSLVSWEVISDL